MIRLINHIPNNYLKLKIGINIKKLLSNRSSRVLTLVTFTIAAVIGVTSFLHYTGSVNADKPIALNAQTEANQIDKQPKTFQNYVKVPEWKVSFGISNDIKDTTYHMSGNTIWLSTLNLDQKPECYNPSAADQTFASITKLGASDNVTIQTTPTDAGTTITANEALKANQFEFRKIDGFIYEYKQSASNDPCAAETHAQVNAFTDAWLSLKSI